MEANQPTDRQRLAAVLETLARVLRSEAELLHQLDDYVDSGVWLRVYCKQSPGVFKVYDISRLEFVATNAAKLAGVEAAKAVGDE